MQRFIDTPLVFTLSSLLNAKVALWCINNRLEVLRKSTSKTANFIYTVYDQCRDTGYRLSVSCYCEQSVPKCLLMNTDVSLSALFSTE